MTKIKTLQKIKNLSADPPQATAFITDGRYYWADGMHLFPEQIAKHKGPLVQFHLINQPTPDRVKSAVLVPVDNWLQADELARRTLSKEAYKVETTWGFVLKSLQEEDGVPEFVVVSYCDQDPDFDANMKDVGEFFRDSDLY